MHDLKATINEVFIDIKADSLIHKPMDDADVNKLCVFP